MDYIVTFLEGLISFISPCMLPMLPIYISYFAAGADKKGKMIIRVCSFVGGFTVVFAAASGIRADSWPGSHCAMTWHFWQRF